MNYKQILIDAFNVYCRRTGRTPSGVSNLIFNDGKFYDRINAGGGCTMDTYQKGISWFQENTPTEEPKKSNKKTRSN